ncbi:MAG TPA: ABC transporter ATP-binding protein [Dehalococcoidia bacterium]|jgi:tungstate transport system ATP-binding protein|nr:molybdenum ABC transporter ATP-binding protein [Chloroflexota bacterium]MDP6055697.1 ABC transporter ATP-binding protein [Dehalococcoidia bacterium]MDP7262794.1 ABC transporter ATP-binding protein [Dehalococcoidia bacterium]MDP7484820.1 ABC transporter ATP-binding protein [Dehalococcoidia bacterium]HJP27848.1 ABC transporter ATP-binding protein [Dehalococcoidia bacterium]|tara:strand:- start:146 stop:1288 length:1143 start_codon:yes stop_codon:yes gene_type:complete
MTSSVVELREVKVERDGRTVLDIQHLQLELGKTLTVIGPNGAGKSTLLRVVGLLERPTHGTVFHHGEATGDGKQDLILRRRLAVVMQRPFMRNASTWDNVATGLKFRGIGGSEAKRRVGDWLDRLGIAHLADRNARELSGGEAQRASLARGLVLEPDLLLLDEPFAALDEPTRLALHDDLRNILQKVQTATLFVTHNRIEAQTLSDELAVLMDGNVRQAGSSYDVFYRPNSEEVATFVGMENIFSAHIIEQSGGLAAARVGRAEITLVGSWQQGDYVLLGLRPETVQIEPVKGEHTRLGSTNRLQGRITAIMPFGGQARVIINCGFPLVSIVTQQSLMAMRATPGMSVLATFQTAALHIIDRSRQRVTLTPTSRPDTSKP